MAQDDIQHKHPTIRRTSHKLSLLASLMALTLVARNSVGTITYDKPLTEASFIAQVRATNP